MDWGQLSPWAPRTRLSIPAEHPETPPLLLWSGSEIVPQLLEVRAHAGEARNVPRAKPRHGERLCAWPLLLISFIAAESS